jgi:hypothetical protein
MIAETKTTKTFRRLLSLIFLSEFLSARLEPRDKAPDGAHHNDADEQDDTEHHPRHSDVVVAVLLVARFRFAFQRLARRRRLRRCGSVVGVGGDNAVVVGVVAVRCVVVGVGVCVCRRFSNVVVRCRRCGSDGVIDNRRWLCDDRCVRLRILRRRAARVDPQREIEAHRIRVVGVLMHFDRERIVAGHQKRLHRNHRQPTTAAKKSLNN